MPMTSITMYMGWDWVYKNLHLLFRPFAHKLINFMLVGKLMDESGTLNIENFEYHHYQQWAWRSGFKLWPRRNMWRQVQLKRRRYLAIHAELSLYGVECSCKLLHKLTAANSKGMVSSGKCALLNTADGFDEDVLISNMKD